MVRTACRLLIGCATALLASGCTHQVAGLAVLPYSETPGPAATLAVNADQLMLELPRIRAITGAGEDLNVIPSMDGTVPTDIDVLADEAPAPCRFIFAETMTFGPQIADFHKTTYQSPPDAALISQAAAVYRDPPTARRAFEHLVDQANACAQTAAGPLYVGYVASGADSLQTRPGNTCGRNYQLKSGVLAEVTFCGFPESISDIVMTNILQGVPG